MTADTPFVWVVNPDKLKADAAELDELIDRHIAEIVDLKAENTDVLAEAFVKHGRVLDALVTLRRSIGP